MPGTLHTRAVFKALLAAVTAASVALGPIAAHAQPKAGRRRADDRRGVTAAGHTARRAPSEEAIAEAARRYDLGFEALRRGRVSARRDRVRAHLPDHERLPRPLQHRAGADSARQLRPRDRRAERVLEERRRQGLRRPHARRSRRISKCSRRAPGTCASSRTLRARTFSSTTFPSACRRSPTRCCSTRASTRSRRASPATTRAPCSSRSPGAIPSSSTIKLEKIPEGRSRVVVKEVQKESISTWIIATWTATGVLAVGAGVTGGLGIKAANDLEDLRRKRTRRPRATSAIGVTQRAGRCSLAADIMGCCRDRDGRRRSVPHAVRAREAARTAAEEESRCRARAHRPRHRPEPHHAQGRILSVRLDQAARSRRQSRREGPADPPDRA